MSNAGSRRRSQDVLVVGQINLQNSKSATADIREVIRRRRTDVLLMQEPYTLGGKVRGLGLEGVMVGNQGEGTRPMAAIYFSRDYDPLELMHMSTAHMKVAQLMLPMVGEVFVVSAYFQCGQATRIYVDALERILDQLEGRQILVGMDANARSLMWHSNTTDEEGSEVEDLLLRKGLVVLNGITELSTHRAGGNIDITVATPGIAARVVSWEVLDEGISDHRLIELTLRTGSARSISEGRRVQMIKRMDVNLLNSRLSRELSGRDRPEDPERAAEEFTKALCVASEVAIPTKRTRDSKVPWWSDRLQALKTRVNRARRDFQRCCTCRMKLVKEGVMRAAVARYKWEIKRSKKMAWESFVKESMGKDPFGYVYKLAREKVCGREALTSITRGDSFTLSIEDTMTALLDRFFPRDDAGDELDSHRACRELMGTRYEGETEEDFSMPELEEALSRAKNNKAPGPDGIKMEVIKALNDENLEVLLELYNGCWRAGVFPKIWKTAEMVLLRKTGERDWREAGSYRPISLLSVLGKTLERLVSNRWTLWGEERRLLSPDQFGFRKGKSAMDAIEQLLGKVRESDSKYVMAVFMDIRGAFDNVWWPKILETMRDTGVSGSIYGIVKSYLSDRKIGWSRGEERLERTVELGCPQGSVLGPQIWNWIMNRWLVKERPEWLGATAYADDLTLTIKGKSRIELEARGQEAMEQLQEWARECKLQFCPRKTKGLVLKGKLDQRRPPVVKMDGATVGFSGQVQCLGLTLDGGLTFLPHIKTAGSKAKAMFGKVVRLARLRFGVRPESLKVLYRAVFEPMILYGARAWGHRADNSHIKRALRSAQRTALLGITGAYRTTSGAALRVLAGVSPLDMRARELKELWEVSTGLRRESKSEVKKRTLRCWQEEWESEEVGRFTWSIFPDVRERNSKKYVSPGYKVIQFLSGHGAFGDYLYGLGRRENELCECGEPDGPAHVLQRCRQLLRIREEYLGNAEEEDYPDLVRRLISTPDGWRRLVAFATAAQRARSV